MTDVFGFLISRTLHNRSVRQVRRLREPRYLIPTVISVAWALTWVLRPFMGGHVRTVVGWRMLSPDAQAAFAFLGGIAIFVWVALLWILPSSRAALQFSPAETHFLFTAPVTRRQILNYKLLNSQIGILFGAVISSFFSGARFYELSGWARLFGFWLFFATMHLHGIAAGLVRTDLIDRGWSGLKRRAVTILVGIAFLVVAALATRDAWFAIAEGLARIRETGGDDWKAWEALASAVAEAGRHGVAAFLLWPFLVLPRLLMVTSVRDLGWDLLGGVAILGLHYVWVMRTDASFEEASAELAVKHAARRAARQRSRRAGPLVKKARPFWWRLAPIGPPEVAIVWKNIIQLTRVTPLRMLIAMGGVLLAVTSVLIKGAKHPADLWLGAATLGALLAAFSAFLGPVFQRNDLREDLFRIDAIKTFPMSGRQLVRGEVLGSWTPIFVLQIAFTTLAVIAYSYAGAPAVGGLTGEWMYAVAAASLLVLPGIAMGSIALQNAMVILFPAWVALGNSRARGFEASGQRILMLFVTLFVLCVFALPAGASGGVAAWLLVKPLGPVSLVFGGMIAGAWLVAETWVGCWFLGGLFDRIDPSTAGIEPSEESV